MNENKYFHEIKGNFGFGCMRLPLKDGRIDEREFSAMVDAFLQSGFNYFDTAHGYHDGKSETAIKKCLTDRYPRSSYLITDKLTEDFFAGEKDIRPFFESQLKACGVEYFDFYLMHALSAGFYKKFQACRAFETACALKAEGKIRHLGLSFHDKAEVLDQILTEHPETEVVQIQFNYVDYEDAGIESRLCYEVCQKHHKPVIVMEPVKGGSLVNLPEKALAAFKEAGGKSPASYALRFAAGFDGMMMVLSGMSNLKQVEENIRVMSDFTPLSENELKAVDKVRGILRAQDLIACTACRYCTAGCPKAIAIPDLFACMNAKKTYHDWNSDWYYFIHTQNGGKASDCIGCGKCEKSCPQHLSIRALLKDVAAEFEK